MLRVRCVAVRCVAVLCVAVLCGVFACKERSECEEVCARVARCRAEARDGEPGLGDKPPPPDARCMKRCRDQHDEWSRCEAKNRTCEALRGCYGPLR